MLTGKILPPEKDAASVAKHLVHHYKDHSFVIDTEEALRLLGSDLIKEQSPEYGLADDLYVLLEFVQLKRFPADLNRRDSQRVKDERVFVH